MPDAALEYRRHAAEALHHATTATDPELAAYWRTIADAYMTLVRCHELAGGTAVPAVAAGERWLDTQRQRDHQ